MNFFPHSYGDARNSIGIIFCTVAVSVAEFLSEFIDKNGISGFFFELSEQLLPRNGQKTDFNRYMYNVKDDPSHVLFR